MEIVQTSSGQKCPPDLSSMPSCSNSGNNIVEKPLMASTTSTEMSGNHNQGSSKELELMDVVEEDDYINSGT